MEVGLRIGSSHSYVKASLTGWLKVMYELLWRADRGQGTESHRRDFLVVLRFIIDDVEDSVFMLTLRSRREDSDYVIGLDMCPLSVWCWSSLDTVGKCDRSSCGMRF